jgi:hypothetical protein
MLMNRKCEILKGPPYGFENVPLVSIEKWSRMAAPIFGMTDCSQLIASDRDFNDFKTSVIPFLITLY